MWFSSLLQNEEQMENNRIKKKMKEREFVYQAREASQVMLVKSETLGTRDFIFSIVWLHDSSKIVWFFDSFQLHSDLDLFSLCLVSCRHHYLTCLPFIHSCWPPSLSLKTREVEREIKEKDIGLVSERNWSQLNNKSNIWVNSKGRRSQITSLGHFESPTLQSHSVKQVNWSQKEYLVSYLSQRLHSILNFVLSQIHSCNCFFVLPFIM